MGKILWLSIKSNEMMRDDMKIFIRDLKTNNVKYESYASSKRIYIEIKNPSKEAEKLINEWCYYHPISVLNKKPNIDNCDFGYF